MGRHGSLLLGLDKHEWLVKREREFISFIFVLYRVEYERDSRQFEEGTKHEENHCAEYIRLTSRNRRKASDSRHVQHQLESQRQCVCTEKAIESF